MNEKNQNPEQIARDKIDEMLRNAGWAIQNKDAIDFNESTSIAVREYQTSRGPADYVLFVNRKPVGIIEAKREEEGHRLSVHEDQAEEYARSTLKYIDNDEPLSFVYESTGVITRFADLRDPKPRFRSVFAFHKPETLDEWINEEDTLRERLLALPELPTAGLRDCQINAITKLDESLKNARPRALIQMATGSGKTYTAITFVYRLLKFANARRILFLVDTRNLGEQAEQEFMAYTPSDDNRKFTELYSVQRLRSKFIDPTSQVCISTIQRMYSILRGEELDEHAEEENPNERFLPKEPMPVVYNDHIPIEFFDFIVIDECHRSIYNLWRQVLEYYDAFLIGLTATPDQRTFAFFMENIVSEYTHEQAVADGVNVGYEVYTIETEITKNGKQIKAKEYIDKRDKLTRRKRWEQLDEDYAYTGKDLDRDVVNVSQIRNIIRTFKNKLPEIFPARNEVPKTLVFAKTDSHADDIIQIVREEFNEGNEFCKKITYQTKEDPKTVLKSFRTDYNPRIAVTVDMIATGTDVKPIECLLFMRDVRSRNYFEQMKGRGTRTLQYDDLKKVTPSAVTAKTHFVIVDAVGVVKSVKTDSKSLERKKTMPLKDLLNAVMMGSRDEDTVVTLAGRLARVEREMNEKEKEEFSAITGGTAINQVIHGLLDSCNADIIESRAREIHSLSEHETVTDSHKKAAQDALIEEAAQVFSGKLNTYIEEVRRSHEQIIDTVNIDTVEFAGWDKDSENRAKGMVDDFSEFIKAHRDEITALEIFYSQPYRIKEVTYGMIKEVLDVLKKEKPYLAPLHVWLAFEHLDNLKHATPLNELTALVALIRRVTGIDSTLQTFESTVNRNFQKWVFDKNAGHRQFTEEQMEWLRMIKEHIVTSFHIERDDLEYTPFDSKGGMGKMYELFGDEMDVVVGELNEVLVG